MIIRLSFRASLELLALNLLVILSETANELKTEVSYLLLGVSGTLQDGFPLRKSLDFHKDDEQVSAVFLGKAVVRGYKAYLDIKEENCREYKSSSKHPVIPNAVVLPTGCREHANLYHIYAIDHRQMANILLGEPRFLSVTPDTGLLDLLANETDRQVKALCRREVQRQDKTDLSVVAVPLVTGVWFQSSYVESPVVREIMDGTLITSYDESLALWAGVERDHLVQVVASDEEPVCQTTDENRHQRLSAEALINRAWETVYDAIRQAERTEGATVRPDPDNCLQRVRFGVSTNQARINYPLSEATIMEAINNDETAVFDD